MLPFITAATAIADKVLNRKKGESAKDLKAMIKGRLDSGDPVLTRDSDHFFDERRAISAVSDIYETGETPAAGEAKPVRWKQFGWSKAQVLGESTWTDVTWRFYENGLVAFHAGMKNASEGLDFGDTQGHRIELRTVSGWMMGAWKAGFFVHRRNAVSQFAGYFKEEHDLLALHFDELAEVQTGIWYHGGEGIKIKR